MLQFIRNNTKGVIAWIIVGLLIIPFALWGVNEYFAGGSGDMVVATIGDREIQSREFQSLYQRELSIRRQIAPDTFDASDPSIRRDVLDRLINSEVMSQTAIRAGFRVSDEQLGRQIRSMREFQTDGRFDPELYDRLLRISGLSRPMFEENLRRDLMIEQLIAGVVDTAMLTGHELERWLKLSEQQRRFGYLVLAAEDYLALAEVSDEDIARHYRENIDRYEVPEQVRAEYLELSLDGLRDQVSVDEATLRRMYDERAGAFSVGEERKVRHILLGAGDPADAEAIALALATAGELRERIAAGDSFADLAREYSEDSGSAADGGDLGFISRGTMPESFEEAVFALAEGEVGAPVQTPFGVHLVRVDTIRPGSRRSFEEVRAQLRDDYLNARADEQFFELTERLADLTFEHPDTLVVAAEDLGIEIRETAYFSREQGEGVAAGREFRAAAFSGDVFEAGNNSPLIELGPSRVVVLRVQDRRPAAHRPLEEVQAQIARTLRETRAAALAEEEGRRILEGIDQGEPPAAAASARGLEWHSEVLAARDDPSVPFDILDAAFAMPSPSGEQPRIRGAGLLGGDYAIIALHEVIDGDPQGIPADERRRNRDALAQLLQQRAGDDFLRSLRDRYEVRVFEDRL